MSRVITFSTVFPITHHKSGQRTHFVEKIWKSLRSNLDRIPAELYPYVKNYVKATGQLHIEAAINYFTLSPKHHTIREGNHWKVGDRFSPRIWSGKPFRSKQVQFAPDIEIKKIWTFEMDLNGVFCVNGTYMDEDQYQTLAKNDGLSEEDLFLWLMPNYDKPKKFEGQIICWNESINYD